MDPKHALDILFQGVLYNGKHPRSFSTMCMYLQKLCSFIYEYPIMLNNYLHENIFKYSNTSIFLSQSWLRGHESIISYSTPTLCPGYLKSNVGLLWLLRLVVSPEAWPFSERLSPRIIIATTQAMEGHSIAWITVDLVTTDTMA